MSKSFFSNFKGSVFPSSARSVINASAAEQKMNCVNQYGRNPVVSKDPSSGAEDLIYDPTDPEQIAPFGCLLNAAKAHGITLPTEIPDWHQGLMGNAEYLADDMPDKVMLGHEEVGGGMGVLADACNQGSLGSCVAACGTNVVEDTIRAETLLYNMAQFWPEISIRYLYYFAQGRYSRPGGDGAMTSGLAHALMTYTGGWVGKNRPELAVNGRFGGVVHEREFEGSANYPVETRGGLPYDIGACRSGIAVPRQFVELGVTHRAGYAGGDIRRVRSAEQSRQVIASGHVMFSGIGWPGAWGNVDRNGFCTSAWRGGGGGHEVELCGYIARPAQSGYGGSNTATRELAEGDDFWGDVKNSWGLQFGKRGHTIVPYAQIVRSGYFNEACAISFADGWDKTIIIDLLQKFKV